MWLSFWVTCFVVSIGLSVVAQLWLVSRWRKLRIHEWREEQRKELEDESIFSNEVFWRDWERNSEIRRLLSKRWRCEEVPAPLYWPLTLFMATTAGAVIAMLLVFLVGSIGS